MDSHDTASSTTFITAWVYADLEPATAHEPGWRRNLVGFEPSILAQPAGSALRRDLVVRYEYVSQAVVYQDHFHQDLGWPAWWSDVRPGPTLSEKRGSDNLVADESAKNASRISTSGGGEMWCGLDGLGIVDCGTSTSRRSMKRS